MTLSGNVSWGMSLTNIACDCELDFRFKSRWKKLSTGLIWRYWEHFLLSARKMYKIFMFMVLRALYGLVASRSFPLQHAK